ncbi:non-ribosomal peptide synthetase, partial [Lysobacter fragariae]
MNTIDSHEPAAGSTPTWHPTQTPLHEARHSCVHTLFEMQAARTPDVVAVTCEARSLGYAELNRRANQLACHLRDLGVKPDDRVAVCIDRDLQLVVALLGVLKAGAAYVPIDPGYPAERIAYVLRDSAPSVVLTQTSLQGVLPADLQAPIVVLDGVVDAARIAWNSENNAEVPGLTAAHLAYVIYTSGSTGEPKGVMVEHRNLANLIGWHNATFGIAEGIRSSSVASVAFDACVWEIWPSLCAGGQLVLPPSAAARDPGQLLQWWAQAALDVGFLPTPLAEWGYAEGAANPQLRTLLVGGDRLKKFPKLPASTTLVNNYGPTETTVVATSARLDANDPVLHIGRPIANTQVHILDDALQPVPPGEIGELYIGGAGVARGYLNRDDLTAERFIADPFVPGGRLYKTGDLGRWRADGNIEYIGRNDFQVKIRGFRIELGEIEARLATHAGVRETVVLAREDLGSDKRLVAYLTLEAGATLDPESLRAHLAAALPEYMVPAAYVALPVFPLTPNGKLDRKALPAPPPDAYFTGAYEAPRGPVERTLARVWAGLLKRERIGRNDDFFELGGHSLLANTMVVRVRQALKIDIALKDLFANSRLAAFAQVVKGAARGKSLAIVPVSREQALPLSFAQQRLWFMDQVEGTSDAYNVALAWRLHGTLDRNALHRALDRIVHRHEALRTTFHRIGNDPVQHIAAADVGF